MNTLNLLITFSILLLAGCASTENYEKLLRSWVGVNADNLVSMWGPPKNSYALADGGKVIEYDRQRSFQTGGYTYTTPVTTHDKGNINVYGGGRTVTGNYNNTSTTYVPQQAPIQTWNMNCITRFTVDSKNIIINWAWEGNDCKANKQKESISTRQPGQYN